MSMVNKILCPVDVYDFQPGTVEYAVALAAALNADIIVLYVIEPLPPYYYGEGYYGESGNIPSPLAEEEAAKRNAKAKMAEIMTTYFCNVCQDKGEVVLGNPAEQIVSVAEESSVDMIVMASHGRSILGRVIHGSVTNKVLANTKIPVLVIPPKES